MLDQELVRRCLQGNENAWADLVRSHRRRIYAVGFSFTRCSAEAEDLTQNVFLRVYQTLDSYRAANGSLSGWLYQVARNLLIDGYRRSRRRPRFSPIQDPLLPIEDSRAPNPLQYLLKDEKAAWMRGALQRLSPDTRQTLILHDLEGMTFQEIASHLHIPVGTVKSRMIRGRRELARILHRSAEQRQKPERRYSAKRAA